MGILNQTLTENYALWNGDCMDVMASLPSESVHLTIYSPPFGGLYQYSSDERDLSNCLDYDEFLDQYGYIVAEKHRITLPGRMSAVHCMDIPTGNTGLDTLKDFPGDLIRLHAKHGWSYVARYHIWKEPLTVRNRTMTKSLAHKTCVSDSTRCSVANADYLLIFRRSGVNPVPVAHPTGLLEYSGERKPPSEFLQFRNFHGSQLENRYSQWVWRQYASAFWDDVRLDRVLPYREARDAEDERHVHPLQLDVIDRGIQMWSNPGERVFTPFMGVGSEVYSAVRAGRLGMGAELKPAYFHQAIKNVLTALDERAKEQAPLFADAPDTESVA